MIGHGDDRPADDQQCGAGEDDQNFDSAYPAIDGGSDKESAASVKHYDSFADRRESASARV
jgi:hypothetical protein